jgi:hypothetical protein
MIKVKLQITNHYFNNCTPGQAYKYITMNNKM